MLVANCRHLFCLSVGVTKASWISMNFICKLNFERRVGFLRKTTAGLLGQDNSRLLYWPVGQHGWELELRRARLERLLVEACFGFVRNTLKTTVSFNSAEFYFIIILFTKKNGKLDFVTKDGTKLIRKEPAEMPTHGWGPPWNRSTYMANPKRNCNMILI